MAKTQPVKERAHRKYNLFLSPAGYRVLCYDNSLSPNVYSGYGFGFNGGYEAARDFTEGGFMLSSLIATTHYTASAKPGRMEYQFGMEAWKAWKVKSTKRMYFDAGPDLKLAYNFHVPFSTDNNFLSYDIANSLGITAKARRPLRLFKRDFDLSDRLTIPVFTYLIRPAYTGPYPQAFLKNGVFSTTGLVDPGSAIESGAFVSWGRYFNIDNQIRLKYPFLRNSNAIALTYDWNFYRASLHDKRALFGSQGLLFSLIVNL